MQIHELNTFAGTPGDNNFLAIDNGSDTGKISGTNLLKPVNDRITNLANSVTPDSVEEILNTPAGASPGPATLSKSVANFDYLEFYFAQIDGANINNAGYLRVPVSYNNVDVSIPVKDGSGLWVQELKLAWSGTTLTISNIKLWEWDGAANSAASSQSNTWVTDVVRVIGIKTSSNTPAELADIRVGANGITYPSAGDAVRGQYTDLDTRVDSLESYFIEGINFFNPNDPDLVDNVELVNNGTTNAKTGYFASGYIPVRPGETICCHYPTGTYGNASSIVGFDENKQRIIYSSIPSGDRLQDANGYNYIRYTFPNNTTWKYFRLTGSMAGKSYYMYVYANTMPADYTPYTTDVDLSSSVKVDFQNVENVVVDKDDTNFINDTSINLVDFNTVETGIVTSSNNNGNIDSTVTNWVTTDFIPVTGGETYTLCIMPGNYYGANFAGIPYYDENKNFLGRVKQPGGSVATIASRVTITLPNQPNIKYIRASYYKSYIENPNRWWMCQVFHAPSWPGDMFVPYDGSDKIQATRLDDLFSNKYNPLWGKSAMWNGDSICAADNDTVGGGWPGRIASLNGMKFKNYGVSGGTIAENTGANHSVSATLDGMLTDFPNSDYIIIEGGTNDADILGTNGIGTFDANDFTDNYINNLNKDSFSGALESIFYRLVTVMKGKHIGFLIPQKMGHTEILVARRRVYFDRAVEICQKWGIPYLDLWNGLYFNWRLAAHWDQNMSSAQNEAAGNLYLDGQHLTTTGYSIESPVIAEWLKTI